MGEPWQPQPAISPHLDKERLTGKGPVDLVFVYVATGRSHLLSLTLIGHDLITLTVTVSTL